MVKAVDMESGYENVAATCPHCGTRNVFNRATDIGHCDPIDNKRVTCTSPTCAACFDIIGDLINPAQEMLLLDSYEFIKEKRYIQAVLSATTAYESFFSRFLRVQLVYRPSHRDQSPRNKLQWLNAAATALQERTERMTFEPMRQVFLRAAVDDVRPPTIGAADEYIQSIPKQPPKIARAEVEAVPDKSRGDVLLRVYDATIATLRNKIVHKSAYRPHQDEAKAAIDDAYTTVFQLGQHYNLASDNYHLNVSDSE